MTVAIKREFTASEARNNFSEVFNAALYEGPVVVHKHSKSVAIIPLDLFEALAELEAKLDSEKARRALNEFFQKGGTPMSDLKKELGID